MSFIYEFFVITFQNSINQNSFIMATYAIENYVLRYDMVNNRPWIIFHYKVDGSWKNKNWFPPKEDAVYLSDMLRNEKPLYYVESGSSSWITSTAEEIGEEET